MTEPGVRFRQPQRRHHADRWRSHRRIVARAAQQLGGGFFQQRPPRAPVESMAVRARDGLVAEQIGPRIVTLAAQCRLLVLPRQASGAIVRVVASSALDPIVTESP
ncbi:MAG: hypothetical protein OEO20_04955 [Gemmatimonadota bacterium]|nr:hypothetical protein [Gemmatimonadota bacterium]MDH3366375.1 hypothetical protein [Gemmatimonadota bacterium]MDH3477633.1 hypothetical protein [Gemmatimonadota bacterium]MDH3568548.1 hypothetical protein [Gemmatimonadota bacterium]MDH5549988.1 hypothetical protein [Gemmatimonadota bacterium]